MSGAAYLPGVGRILNPQPEHYRVAIRFLQHSEWPACQRSLCARLIATERRLEWTPRRLRKMREQAA